MKRSVMIKVLVIFTMLIASARTRAAIIGVSFSGNGSTTGPVARIDEELGAGVVIGFAGLRLNSLAKNSSGVLYSAGQEGGFGTPPSFLVTVDPSTGRASPVAMLDFGKEVPRVTGLAFSPSDTLFAIHRRVLFGPTDLFSIDIQTGIATPIGSTGLVDLQALTFSPAGILYGWDVSVGLVTIDPQTGITTDVNPFVGSPVDIQGIAFGNDGSLFGAREALYRIDQATGTPTLVGSGGYADIRGIEFLDAIPEPGTWALALVAAAVVILILRKHIRCAR